MLRILPSVLQGSLGESRISKGSGSEGLESQGCGCQSDAKGSGSQGGLGSGRSQS